MGLDITYKAGESELSFRLPPSDIDILEFLRKRGYEQEVEIIFGVSEFGELTEVKRGKLLGAVNNLVGSVRKNNNALPYIYSAKEEIPRGSGMYSEGGGIISGFKIDGVTHCLEAGLEKCELRKKWQDENGKIYIGEAEDIRHLKMLKIDENNFSGDIEIKRKRKPTKLIQNLEKLKLFLSKTSERTIYKILG